MKAIVSASSRVLSVFRTPCVIGTPKWASYISGVFESIAATVSPFPTPRPTRADASRRQRASVSAHVKRRDPCTTDARRGNVYAAQARNVRGVRGAQLAAFLSSATSYGFMIRASLHRGRVRSWPPRRHGFRQPGHVVPVVVDLRGNPRPEAPVRGVQPDLDAVLVEERVPKAPGLGTRRAEALRKRHRHH